MYCIACKHGITYWHFVCPSVKLINCDRIMERHIQLLYHLPVIAVYSDCVIIPNIMAQLNDSVCPQDTKYRWCILEMIQYRGVVSMEHLH